MKMLCKPSALQKLGINNNQLLQFRVVGLKLAQAHLMRKGFCFWGKSFLKRSFKFASSLNVNIDDNS